MSKWLRRESARECPVHKLIMEMAIERLSNHGSFCKDEILTSCNMQAMSDAIRWDYVREFIVEGLECDVMPVAASYFKRHPKMDELKSPERYLALGHGKKTAGYIAVTPENDHLVVCRVDQRVKQTNGVTSAFKSWITAVEKVRGAPVLTSTQKALPNDQATSD